MLLTLAYKDKLVAVIESNGHNTQLVCSIPQFENELTKLLQFGIEFDELSQFAYLNRRPTEGVLFLKAVGELYQKKFNIISTYVENVVTEKRKQEIMGVSKPIV